MVTDYIDYWRRAVPIVDRAREWFSADDPRLIEMWTSHTSPGTASWDPQLKELLHAVGGSDASGYTRRIDQVSQIVAAARCGEGDVVFECFAGPGAITIPLAVSCRRVVAVEVNASMAQSLARALAAGGVTNVEFVIGDIRSRNTRDVVRHRHGSSITKHVHTPGYAVIPETIQACTDVGPAGLTMVLPLSLLRAEWAERDYVHIQTAQRWFAARIKEGLIKVLGVMPIRKQSGKASSAIFSLTWKGSPVLR